MLTFHPPAPSLLLLCVQILFDRLASAWKVAEEEEKEEEEEDLFQII